MNENDYGRLVAQRLTLAQFTAETPPEGAVAQYRRRIFDRGGMTHSVVVLSELRHAVTPDEIVAFCRDAVVSAHQGTSWLWRGTLSNAYVMVALMTDAVSDEAARFVSSYSWKPRGISAL